MEVAAGRHVINDQTKIHVDYSPTLESEASRHAYAGHHNLAVLLHATRVEHWLNHMIVWALERRGFDEKYRATVIREAQLRAKTGWLWQLLFNEPMPRDLVRRIETLTEARNRFVHHKYTNHSLFEFDQQFNHTKQLGESGSALGADLLALEDSIIYAGNWTAIREAFAGTFIHPADEPLT